jgi:hypothetical protein
LAPGGIDWNNPNMRFKDMREYAATVITNNADELLEASFICERAQFKNNGGQWRGTLEEVFINKMEISYSENEEMIDLES